MSKRWVDEATRPQPTLVDGNVDGDNWWINEATVGGRVFRWYGAGGNGGQVVTVVPELDLVIAFTAGNYNDFGTWRGLNGELLPQYIIPPLSQTRRAHTPHPGPDCFRSRRTPFLSTVKL